MHIWRARQEDVKGMSENNRCLFLPLLTLSDMMFVACKLFKVETEVGSVNAHPILTMLQAEEKPSKELYDKAIRQCGRSGLMHVSMGM